MADAKIRVGKHIYERLKLMADQSGKSIRELAEEALEAYLFGREGVDSKQIKGITAKIIEVQYPTRCAKCGRPLKPGDLAYWVKITYTDNTVRSKVYCLECYYQSGALKEYYLKKRQLEVVIRELKKEADKLADEVNQLRATKSYYELQRELGRAIAEANDLLTIITDPDREKALREVLDRLNKLDEYLEKLKELEDKLEYVEAKAREATRRLDRVERRVRREW